MSTISTHVLDTALGRPAAGIPVTIELASNGRALGSGTTDADGRIRDLLSRDGSLAAGIYRLRFEVAQYFTDTKRDALYPEIVIVFRVTSDEQHYHIPLLLSPFGYSTYRGS